MPLAIDVALKGGLILLLAGSVAWALRHRSASTRYTVWITAMVCLLALPVLAAVMPSWHSSMLPQPPENWWHEEKMQTELPSHTSKLQSDIGALVRPTPRAPAVLPMEATSTAPREAVSTQDIFPANKAETQATPSLQRAMPVVDSVPTWLASFAGLYFVGALALLARLAFGVWGVWRIVRRAGSVRDAGVRADFEAILADLDLDRPVALLESEATPVPVAWELHEPVVLLPCSARDWPRDRLRIAILHELAHIRRRDCQLQILANAALALHWINPVAWWAAKQLRIEREHACDDAVLGLGTRASDYAEHLLQVARGLLPTREPHWAAVAMARSSNLEGRVTAILDPLNRRSLPNRRTTMTALVTALVLLLPFAALQPGAQAQQAKTSPTASQPESVESYVSTPHLPEHETSVHEVMSQAAESVVHTAASAIHSLVGLPTTSSVQEGDPTIDQLVQMRIHGVSPEFIEDVTDSLGRRVDVRELIQMKIHGASPELIDELRALMPNEEINLRDVVQLQIHNASPAFIRGMQDQFDDLSVHDLIQMRIHGATAEYVQTVQRSFDENVTMRDIVQLRIHGASTEYIADMQSMLADESLEAHDITQMRIHGVSTELVRELQEDGYENLTAHDLVQMKIHGFDRWLKRRGGQ